jgi:hypothetical protein
MAEGIYSLMWRLRLTLRNLNHNIYTRNPNWFVLITEIMLRSILYRNPLYARLQIEMKNAHIILEAVPNHDHPIWWKFPSGENVKQWSWIWLIGPEFSA